MSTNYEPPTPAERDRFWKPGDPGTPLLRDPDDQAAKTVAELEAAIEVPHADRDDRFGSAGIAIHDHSLACRGCDQRAAQLAELRSEVGRLTQALDRERLSQDYKPDGVDLVMNQLQDTRAERDRLAGIVEGVRAYHANSVHLLHQAINPDVREWLTAIVSDLGRALDATEPEASDAPPACPDHREVQHRDGRPRWCDACGWRHGRPALPPREVVRVAEASDGSDR